MKPGGKPTAYCLLPTAYYLPSPQATETGTSVEVRMAWL